MKRWLFALSAFILAACAAPAVSSSTVGQTDDQPKTQASDLPDLGAAPELSGDVWLNTSHPLRLADLRGKVVLVDMWTLGCINCQHVIPSVRGWHEKYASQGLVVIGNHYPEFDYESKLDNLKQSLVDLNVPYAVVQDNAGTNWRAFNSHAWPSLYLIDKMGHIRYVHIGEGAYANTEAAIQALLNEPAQAS